MNAFVIALVALLAHRVGRVPVSAPVAPAGHRRPASPSRATSGCSSSSRAARSSATCRSRSTCKPQPSASSRLPPAIPQTVERMLEVQTIISRTYAVSHLGRHAREGFDLCATTHCQLLRAATAADVEVGGRLGEAMAHTAGVILLVRSSAGAGALSCRLRRIHQHVGRGLGRRRSPLPRRPARRWRAAGRARALAVRRVAGRRSRHALRTRRRADEPARTSTPVDDRQPR